MKITGRIEKLIAGGYGLIRGPEGIVFCRAGISGELVEVLVTGKAKGVQWAEVDRIIEPSPYRIPSTCPFFPACGGCDFQHLPYEMELDFKGKIVRESLERILHRKVEVDDFSSSFAKLSPLEYRNTISLKGGGGLLGYYRKKTKKIMDIDDCPIARPAIRTELSRWAVKKLAHAPKKLTLRAGNIPDKDGREPVISIADYDQEQRIEGMGLEMMVDGKQFRVSPDSFFQMNISAAELVIQDLKTVLPSGERLLDLFTGVGLFAICLADKYPEVLGFEILPSAVGDFRHNRKTYPNIEEISWNAAQGIGDFIQGGDVILVDPPRGGLPKRLLKELCRARPRALAYISCNPATFARDCGYLLEAGYGFLSPIRLYDMFPRTAHIEVMAIFKYS